MIPGRDQTRASAGIGTLAPIALITPSRTTNTPCSRTSPGALTMRTSFNAYTAGVLVRRPATGCVLSLALAWAPLWPGSGTCWEPQVTRHITTTKRLEKDTGALPGKRGLATGKSTLYLRTLSKSERRLPDQRPDEERATVNAFARLTLSATLTWRGTIFRKPALTDEKTAERSATGRPRPLESGWRSPHDSPAQSDHAR